MFCAIAQCEIFSLIPTKILHKDYNDSIQTVAIISRKGISALTV